MLRQEDCHELDWETILKKRDRQPENSNCLVYFIRNLQSSHRQESLLQSGKQTEGGLWVSAAVEVLCAVRPAHPEKGAEKQESKTLQ